MAQQTFTANASASLSANGTSTATGSITWTTPSLPDGATGWDSIRISGTWSWGGKGNITRVTINGTNTSATIPFDISIAGKTSPLSITCVGGNKNATGNRFAWSNLVVTYVCTVAGGAKLMIREGASLTEIAKVLRKQGGSLVEVDIAESMFNTSQKFVRR